MVRVIVCVGKKLSKKILIVHPLKVLNLSRRAAVIEAGILAWS